MANMLKRQDEEANDESSGSEDVVEIVEKDKFVKAGSGALNTSNSWQVVHPKSTEEPVDIHFNSDSDEEDKPALTKTKVASKAVQPQAKRGNGNEWKPDENDSNVVNE